MGRHFLTKHNFVEYLIWRGWVWWFLKCALKNPGTLGSALDSTSFLHSSPFQNDKIICCQAPFGVTLDIKKQLFISWTHLPISNKQSWLWIKINRMWGTFPKLLKPTLYVDCHQPINWTEILQKHVGAHVTHVYHRADLFYSQMISFATVDLFQTKQKRDMNQVKDMYHLNQLQKYSTELLQYVLFSQEDNMGFGRPTK